MNRIVTYAIALILIACDSKAPSHKVEKSPQEKPPTFEREIARLEGELDAAAVTASNLENEFEAKKGALEAKIDAARKEHEAIRSAQAGHLAALEKAMQEESRKLKEAEGDLATWDPFPLESVSAWREEMMKIMDENMELKAEIERLKKEVP
jgi:chromosome segregation ATPase